MHSLSASSALDDWLAKIEASHPTEIELGLDRVLDVASRLNIDVSGSKVITVAGTNGKGSTCALLESILLASGCSTGVYGSPHFLAFNERIRMGGDSVNDELITDAFSRIDAAKREISLTYFEYATLAALIIFADAQLDFIVLEVGLGGRLDAVNIIDPDIAIITSISLDHTDWLGDDLESIGREKAGIFRPKTPSVVGFADPMQSIVDYAQSLKSPLYVRDQAFMLDVGLTAWNWSGTDASNERVAYLDLPLPHLPIQNACTVLQTLCLIMPDLTLEAIHKGLSTAKLTGRLQRERIGEAELILDVAHNPEAAQYLASLLSHSPSHIRSTVVLGMLSDKDQQGVIDALKPVIDDWCLVSLKGPRASSAQELKQLLGDTQATLFEDTKAALNHIADRCDANDRVLVCGSFLTVTEALSWLQTH